MTVLKKKQMNAGVELLLKRMETNPEEFTDYGKWVSIMQEIHKYAEPEESKALNDGLKALMMQKVTERVLEGLVDPKKSNWVGVIMQQKGITSAGTTPGQYITLETAEHMKAHLEALKVKDRDALVNKKPTTIFGKLFNYL